MDYRIVLAVKNSKQTWQTIINDVGDNPIKFKEAMSIFFSDDLELVKRISQVIGVIGEQQPQLIEPYLPQLVNMLDQNPIISVKRNVLRIFQFIHIPENLEGNLFDKCLTYMTAFEEPKAVKVFSMTILRKICTKYPDLAHEVLCSLEILLSEDKAPGIQSRGKKELKKIRSLLS